MQKSASQYRAEAMQVLTGNYQKPIIFMLILVVYSALFSSIQDALGAVTYSFNSVDFVLIGNPVIYYFLSLVNFAVMSGLAFSTMNLYISVIQKPDFKIEDVLLSGFKKDFLQNVITYFLMNIFIFLWSLLFIIPGIIKSYAYAMTFYFRNREPDLDGNVAITKSKQYMNGNKGRLFILDLSYIGWYILSIFTFGILLFWIVPRHQTARVIMFNEIYGVEEVTPIEEAALEENVVE